MTIKEPESAEGLMYFTNRTIGEGKVMAWTYRPDCPECGEVKLTKPPKKTGPGFNTRAKKYICSNCDYEVSEEKIREQCTLQAKYTCPHCLEEGTSETDYEREKFSGKKAYVIECEHCGEDIPVTKKMKEVDL